MLKHTGSGGDPFFKRGESKGHGGKKHNLFALGDRKNNKNDFEIDAKGNKKDMKPFKKFNKDYKKGDESKLHEIKDGKVSKGPKQFDKKLYRMKKYSNKYKLDQWENKRRKEVLKTYYKDIKNDPMAGKYRPIKFDEDRSDGFDEVDERIHYVLNPERLEEMKQKFGKDKKYNDPKNKIKPFQKVKDEMKRLKEEKIAAKEAKQKAAKEKAEAIAKYKANKAEKFKKLSKKTKSGQPVMKGRMEMLLESIQKMT